MSPWRVMKIVVAGCGFVGLATARLLHSRDHEVLGLTRSPESAAQLRDEPFPIVPCDIGNEDSLAALKELDTADAVVHCASSGRGGAAEYRKVYLEGLRNLLRLTSAKRFVFTSSTSVYAQGTGDWVTEESPTEPTRETAQLLLEAERLLLGRGGSVARLAGIYGPGRSVILERFFSGSATMEGAGERWINQAHRDDIATALGLILEENLPGIFNVADDQPLPQRILYETLAQQFDRPLPPVAPIKPDRKRAWTNKRVSNNKLRATGWRPRYASFLDAVANDRELLRLAQQ